MRELKTSDRNTLTVFDRRSGTEIELYYRSPSSREEALYQARLVKKKGKKILMNAFETRLSFGLAILTGIREGDFGVDGKPISSEQGSPNYCAEWKKAVEEGASDIVRHLAVTVFEGVQGDTGGLELEVEEEVIGEAPPLEKS